MVTARTPLDTAIREVAHPITGAATDFDPLLDLIGDARLVLLGEASHGTHEFYRTRARISRRLIEERGFCAVAAEADWPDAWRVNRYVRGVGDDTSADQALGDFARFPQWMWRNVDVRAFVDWLHAHNDGRPLNRQAGFYGLDLYSLNASMHAVIQYLEQVDPEAAQRARQRYSCFESFDQNDQAYGYAAVVGAVEPCEDQVISQLVELQTHAAEYATKDGRLAEDEYFYAEQNARVAKDAEEYYRIMFRGGPASWNLRDQHMAGTLDALLAHLDRYHDGRAKIVVWEHNSHIGDARATELSDGGELNVGQLVRERHGRACRLIGFSTDHGSVTAASDWDMPAERKQVRPALPGSFEALFHDVGVPAFSLNLADNSTAAAGLRPQRLERAIGVVYRPEAERWSHYFHARLADQFDAVLHFDETHAVEPLERTPQWEAGEVPETFPSTY